MNANLSRRGFLAVAAGAATAGFVVAADATAIKYGYAAITWGKEEVQAIDDISSAGYQGIQLRIDATKEFQPAQLRDLLGKHKLTFVALSSGEVSIDPALEAGEIERHVANARFVRDAGGLYLQLLDKLTAYPRKVEAEECTRLGKILTEIGKRTADLGIPVAYHNHMNTISEHPENLDRVMAASDPRYVKLLLDTAHAVAGGGDPAAMLRKYRERVTLLHLKDVVDIPLDTPGAKYPFQFVELGRGRVDLGAFHRAVEAVQYRGWAVVELDRVPVKGRTAKESALISRGYLEKEWGAKF